MDLKDNRREAANNAATEEYILGGIKVYPSPASDAIIVDMKKLNNPLEVSILSITGQVVLREEVTGLKMRLDIKDLPSGNYIVNVKTEKQIRIERFVKQ